MNWNYIYILYFFKLNYFTLFYITVFLILCFLIYIMNIHINEIFSWNENKSNIQCTFLFQALKVLQFLFLYNIYTFVNSLLSLFNVILNITNLIENKIVMLIICRNVSQIFYRLQIVKEFNKWIFDNFIFQ